MLPSIQRFYAANDYDAPGDAGRFHWRLPRRRPTMTYREHTLGQLALAQIPHYETEGPSGLPEVHIITDEGQHHIMLFTRDGDLLAVEGEKEEA